nr:HNH endonuclease [Rubricoccus marinus]
MLLLHALGRFASSEPQLPYASVEGPLAELLVDFGRSQSRPNPHYPFWRLQRDGVWKVIPTEGIVFTASGDPTITSLRTVNPSGGFAPAVEETFRQRPESIADIARLLLDAHFAPTLHEPILDAVGLDLDALGASGAPRQRRKRDRAFREAVLRAYGYRCAVCGFETRVGRTLVGLDAAHVKWHQAGGADEVPNGLALCALHHRLLDRGAYTLAPSSSHEIIVDVAEDAHGGEGFERWLLAYHGRPLAQPVQSGYRVAEPSAAWHRREVFRGPAREPLALEARAGAAQVP